MNNKEHVHDGYMCKLLYYFVFVVIQEKGDREAPCRKEYPAAVFPTLSSCTLYVCF